VCVYLDRFTSQSAIFPPFVLPSFPLLPHCVCVFHFIKKLSRELYFCMLVSSYPDYFVGFFLLSLCMFLCLFVWLCPCLFICLSAYLFLYVCLSVCLSVFVCLCVSVCPSVCLCLSVHISVSPFVCLPVCLCAGKLNLNGIWHIIPAYN